MNSINGYKMNSTFMEDSNDFTSKSNLNLNRSTSAHTKSRVSECRNNSVTDKNSTNQSCQYQPITIQEKATSNHTALLNQLQKYYHQFNPKYNKQNNSMNMETM